MDYNMPKPQTDIDQKTDVDEIAFSKLQIRQSDPKEELVEVTGSLIPLPMTRVPEDMVEKNDSSELSKVDRKQEEEKYKVYQRTYVGQHSEEEETDTESDYSGYHLWITLLIIYCPLDIYIQFFQLLTNPSTLGHFCYCLLVIFYIVMKEWSHCVVA